MKGSKRGGVNVHGEGIKETPVVGFTPGQLARAIGGIRYCCSDVCEVEPIRLSERDRDQWARECVWGQAKGAEGPSRVRDLQRAKVVSLPSMQLER
jgi:hypothetical protein